jgi:hypothetical protein
MAPELRLILMVSGAALSLQMNKVLPSMIPGISNNLKNDEDVINDLKQKASETSDKHRTTLNAMAEKEHNEAAQKASDLEMIRRKELEYKQLKKEADNTSLADHLILSTESPGMFGNEGKGNITIDNDLRKLEVENLAKKQKIQEINAAKNQKMRIKQLKNDKEKLEMTLKGLISEDGDSDNDETNATEQSSESTISINPNIDKLMRKIPSLINKKPPLKNPKAGSKLKDHGVTDGISLEDITVGSKDNNKKKKKTTKLTLGST